MTHISEDHKADFHAKLHEARELYAREIAASGLYQRDIFDPKANKTLALGVNGNGTGTLWTDRFVYNVSFHVVYDNETRAGGYIE